MPMHLPHPTYHTPHATASTASLASPSTTTASPPPPSHYSPPSPPFHCHQPRTTRTEGVGGYLLGVLVVLYSAFATFVEDHTRLVTGASDKLKVTPPA